MSGCIDAFYPNCVTKLALNKTQIAKSQNSKSGVLKDRYSPMPIY
jgi:hypothetical protein